MEERKRAKNCTLNCSTHHFFLFLFLSPPSITLWLQRGNIEQKMEFRTGFFKMRFSFVINMDGTKLFSCSHVFAARDNQTHKEKERLSFLNACLVFFAHSKNGLCPSINGRKTYAIKYFFLSVVCFCGTNIVYN